MQYQWLSKHLDQNKQILHYLNNGHKSLYAHKLRRKWLKIDRGFASDVWIETIPYKETREYVAAVLTYALIYQSRLQNGTVRMTDFMRDIKSLAETVVSELAE